MFLLHFNVPAYSCNISLANRTNKVPILPSKRTIHTHRSIEKLVCGLLYLSYEVGDDKVPRVSDQYYVDMIAHTIYLNYGMTY